ncbi:hypothetical protein D3C71_1165620 [compost metagenome]
MQILRGVQFDGTVPVAGSAHDPGFFAEARDAQFQRIAEAVDTQLPGVLEGLGRLYEQIRRRIGFSTHGEQRAPQRVSRPGAARSPLLCRQGQHFLEIPSGQGIITRAKCHSTDQVPPDLGRQLRTFGFNLMSIRQAAQVFHQHLLLSGKSRLLGLIP